MNHSFYNGIVNFIWGIADDVLRDVYVRGKYRDVILPMTVIRRLDALLEPTKEQVLSMKRQLDEAKIANQHAALCHASGEAFYNISPFTLRDLRNRAKQQQLKSDFELYLDGFSPNVQEILDKFKFRYQIPALVEEDHSRGILEAIDMESYRVEVEASLSINLTDGDVEIDPVPTSGGGRKPEPEMDQLSNIIKSFNDLFGNIEWKDADRIRHVIFEEIPTKVGADPAYQNAMKNNDKKTARIEHDVALQRVVTELLADHTELFKQFSDDPSFKKWLGDTIFGLTYQRDAA